MEDCLPPAPERTCARKIRRRRALLARYRDSQWWFTSDTLETTGPKWPHRQYNTLQTVTSRLAISVATEPISACGRLVWRDCGQIRRTFISLLHSGQQRFEFLMTTAHIVRSIDAVMELVHNARSADTQPLTCKWTTMRIAEFNENRPVSGKKSRKSVAAAAALPARSLREDNVVDCGGVRNSENSCQLSVHSSVHALIPWQKLVLFFS